MEENPQEKKEKQALGDIGFAQYYIEQKNYSEALKRLESAFKLTPKNRDIWTLMGDVHSYTGKYKDALDLYRKANEISEVAITYYAMGWIFYNRIKDNKKALEMYKKAIELDPKHKASWVDMGLIYDNSDNFDEALNCYEESLKIDPNYAIALNNTGWLYEKFKKDNKTAVSYYRKALEADPNYVTPRKNLMRLKSSKKETAEDWNSEGEAYFQKKNYKEALKHFKKAAALKPGERLYLHNIGKAYHWLRKNKDAIKYFEKANAISPHFDTYLHMGWAYRNLKKYKKALESYKKADEEQPYNHIVTNEIGIIHLRQGNYAVAHGYFKRVTEMKSDYANGWLNAGITYKKLGEYYKAMENWAKALAIDPNHRKTKKAFGTLLRERPYLKDDILAVASGKFDEYLK
jgi:tetratricopeptide (TPR) repeat protein